MWAIERTDQIAKWIIELDDDAREAIADSLFDNYMELWRKKK